MIDFIKAFDSVKWNHLKVILKLYGIPDKLINAITSLYVNVNARIRTPAGISETFTLSKGVLQGDTPAPYLFVIVMDYILREALPNPSLGYTLYQGSSRKPGTYVTDLAYADDVALASHMVENAQTMLTAVERKANPIGLFNKVKTEALIMPPPQISVSAGRVAWTTEFSYLGSSIPDSEVDLKKRIGQAWVAFKNLHNLWKSSLNKQTKMHAFSAIRVPIQFYVCESRTLSLSYGSFILDIQQNA